MAKWLLIHFPSSVTDSLSSSQIQLSHAPSHATLCIVIRVSEAQRCSVSALPVVQPITSQKPANSPQQLDSLVYCAARLASVVVR